MEERGGERAERRGELAEERKAGFSKC